MDDAHSLAKEIIEKKSKLAKILNIFHFLFLLVIICVGAVGGGRGEPAALEPLYIVVGLSLVSTIILSKKHLGNTHACAGEMDRF